MFKPYEIISQTPQSLFPTETSSLHFCTCTTSVWEDSLLDSLVMVTSTNKVRWHCMWPPWPLTPEIIPRCYLPIVSDMQPVGLVCHTSTHTYIHWHTHTKRADTRNSLWGKHTNQTLKKKKKRELQSGWGPASRLSRGKYTLWKSICINRGKLRANTAHTLWDQVNVLILLHLSLSQKLIPLHHKGENRWGRLCPVCD